MFSETMIKALLKTVDFEKIQRDFLNDPRVREGLDLVTTIKNKFETIELQNAQILAELDNLRKTLETLGAKPVKKTAILPKPEKE